MPPSPARKIGLLVHLWADAPVICAGACLVMFLWLLIAAPVPAQARLLLETAAAIGFIVGTMAFASVVGGAALLEEQSQAEPLRFQEAGWILGVPVGTAGVLLVFILREPGLQGEVFRLWGAPLMLCVAALSTLWASLTWVLLRREGLTGDDYACAVYMPRDQYLPLARRKQAWRAVRNLGRLTIDEARAHMPDIVPALAESLRAARNEAQGRRVIELLGGLGAESTGPALIEALQSTRFSNRRAAAVALGKLNFTGAVPALMALAASEKEAGVRRAAVVALGKLKDRLAIPALVTALEDADKLTRQSACAALGKLRALEALPGLKARLQDSDGRVRQSAAKAIERITGEAGQEEDEEEGK